MEINQYEIWIADLDPQVGTETGKTRPVVIIQTDLLNKYHPSTIICPITTQVQSEAEILRVRISKGSTKLKTDCDIMIDQIRAIDNKRLLRRAGELNYQQIELIKKNLSIVLDLEMS